MEMIIIAVTTLLIIFIITKIDWTVFKIARKKLGGRWYKIEYYSRFFGKYYTYWTNDVNNLPNGHKAIEMESYD